LASQSRAIAQLQPDFVLLGRTPQFIQKLRALGFNEQAVDAVSVHEVHTVLQRLDDLLDTQRAPAVIADIAQKLQPFSEEATQIPVQRVYIKVDTALYIASPHSFIGELVANCAWRSKYCEFTRHCFPNTPP
jgi:iron complex transport system substrate-binding protein